MIYVDLLTGNHIRVIGVSKFSQISNGLNKNMYRLWGIGFEEMHLKVSCWLTFYYVG